MARDSQRFVSYQPRRPPPGVAAASLSVSVAAAGPDTAVLRADVQVIWYPPRPAGEYVPATVHAVRITASYLSREARGITRTFTSPAVVSRLAALLNGAHAAPRGAISCPLGQVTYVLAFAPSAKAAPALEAASTGCLILRVSVGNRPQPSLQEPPGLALMLTRMIYGRGGPGGGAVLPP
jgi:hypothetical protein